MHSLRQHPDIEVAASLDSVFTTLKIRSLSVCEAYAGYRRSIAVDIDDSFGKGLRSFLRQVVPDATLDNPMCVFARAGAVARSLRRFKQWFASGFRTSVAYSPARFDCRPIQSCARW